MSDIEERIAEVLVKHEPHTAQRYCCREPNGSFHGFYDRADQWAAHLATVLVTELGLTEETQTLPVFVEDVPRRMVDHGFVSERPACHVEFIPHSQLRTSWHSDQCPDCVAEPGIHDRRRAEILAEGS